MDPKYLLTMAVAVVMLWFALGTIYNVRRGQNLVRWMQGGLPRLGERSTYRWLGSTVAELVIAHGKGATRRVEILAALAPRDLAWNWLLAAMQGRKDVLILRVDLARAPRLALEWANPQTWTGRMALQEAAREEWQAQDFKEQVLMAPKGLVTLAIEELTRLEAPLNRLAPQPVRFALRKDHPHLEVHLPFPDTGQVSADHFFAALQTLAAAVHTTAEVPTSTEAPTSPDELTPA